MTRPSITGFAVVPADIASLGAQVGRGGKAATWLGSQIGAGPNDWGEGGGLSMFGGVAIPLLLEPARAAIDELQRLGMENTAKAGSLATSAGSALATVAKSYAEHDEKWRERFDRTYLENHTPTRLQPGEVVVRGDSTARFQDVANPYENPRYGQQTPGMEHPGGDLWEQNWGIRAYREADKILATASVSSYVRDIVKKVAGRDVINDLVVLIGGLGYELLGDQAIAFRDAGHAFQSVRANIDQGRFEIQQTWSGRVSDEALAWLETYSACCRKHADFLMRAGERMMNLARLLFLAFESINRCLDFLIDQVLKANLITDVATGIRSLFNGENPLHVIAAILGNVTKVSDAVAAAHTIVQGFQGVGEVLAATQPVQAADWPGTPYSVPKGMA
ncbi:MAG: hypothetical protein M3548_08705 [Actinomycetota bacterium]|nr:hypothetical protein [Actinomycetota bacterium]